MFKRLKGKLEEVAQVPHRLPVQRLAQNAESPSSDKQQSESHYSPFRTTKSENEDGLKKEDGDDHGQQQLLIDLGEASSMNDQLVALPGSLEQFTLNEEDGNSNTDAISPIKSAGSFQTVDLSENATSTPNPLSTRTSSELSLQGEPSFLPTYTPPPYLFHPQSDLESASEYEDVSPNLDPVSKADIYQAFQKSRARYYKYRSRYGELVKAYRMQEVENEKIKNVLSEHQDKALRRFSELREESQLEKQAKADLEDNFRLMLDEKDELIRVLQTQVHLLKEGVTFDSLRNTETNSVGVVTDVNRSAAGDTTPEVTYPVDYDALKEKNKRLETLLTKCKETIKGNKDRVVQLSREKTQLQKNLDELMGKLEIHSDKSKNLDETSKTDLEVQLSGLKQQVDNAAIVLAETKQNLQVELVKKEQVVESLQSELQLVIEERNSLQLTVEENTTQLKAAALETEKLAAEADERLNDLIKVLEEEKQSLIHDLSQSKTAAISLLKEELQKQLSSIEEEKSVALTLIEQKWQEKTEKLLAESTQKHNEMLALKDRDLEIVLRAKDEEHNRILVERQESVKLAVEQERVQKSSVMEESDVKIKNLMEEIETLKSEKLLLQEKIEMIAREKSAEHEKFVNELNKTHFEDIQKVKEEMTSQIDALASQKHDWENMTQTNIADLQSKLQAQTAINQHLDEKLQFIENKTKEEAAEYEKSLQNLASEKEAAVRNGESKCNDLSTHYEIEKVALTEKIDALEEIVKNRSEEETSNVDQVDGLSREVETLQSKLESADKEKADLIATLETLQSNLNSIDKEKADLLVEFDQQKLVVAETELLRKTVEELKLERTRLDAEVTTIGLQRNELHSKLAEFEVSIVKTYNDMFALRTKLLQSESIGLKFSQCVTGDDENCMPKVVNNIYSRFEEMVRILHSEIEDLQNQLHTKIVDIEDYDEKLQKIQHFTRDQLEKSLQRDENYKRQLSELSQELNVTKEQVTNATLELQKNQFTCNNIVKENERLRQDHESYVRQIEDYEMTLQKKEEELNCSVSQRMVLEESLNDVHERFRVTPDSQNVEEELLKAREENQTLGMLLEKLEKEVATKDDQLRQLTRLRDEHQEMMETLQQSSTEAERHWINKIEELNQENCILREEYESKIHDIGRRTSHDFDLVYDRENLLREELQNLRHQHEIDGRQVLEELEKLNELKKCLEDVVMEKEITIAELWKRNEIMQPVLFEIASDVLCNPIDQLNCDISSLPKQVKNKLNTLSVEREALVKEKKELESRLAECLAQLEAKEYNIERSKQIHLKQLTKVNNQVTSTTSALRQKITSLHEEIDRQREDFESCKKQLQTVCEQNISSLHSKLAVEREVVQESEEKFISVQNELLTKERTLQRVSQQLKDSQVKQEEMANSIIALNQSIEDVNALVEFESGKYEEKLRNVNEHWEQELRSTADKIRSELQPEVEFYKEKVTILQSEQKELYQKLTSVDAGKTALQVLNDEILANCTKNIEDLKFDHNEKYSCVEIEKNELIKTVSLLKQSLEKSEKEKLKLHSETEKEMKEILCQVDGKMNQVVELEKQIAEYVRERKSLKQTNKDLKNELRKMDDVIKEYTESNVKLNERVKEEEDHVAKQASVHCSLTEELVLLRAQVDESRNRNNEELSKCNQTIEEMKRLNAEEIVNLERNYNQQLQTRVQDFKKRAEVRLAQIKKQMHTSNEEALSESKAELLQLNERISSLESSHEVEIQELEKKKQCIVQELETKLAEVRNELDQIQDRNSQQLQVQQDNSDLVIQELHNRIGVLEEQLTKSEVAFNVEIDALRHENEALQQELESSKEIISDLQKANVGESENSAEISARIVNLEDSLKELEEKKVKLAESLHEKLAQVTEEHRIEKEMLEKELSKKDAQIDESLIVAQENTMERERALERMKLESQKLASQLKKREEQVQQLKIQLASLHNNNRQDDANENNTSLDGGADANAFNSKEEMQKLRESLENELKLIREQRDEAEMKLCELQEAANELGLPEELAKTLQDEKAQIQKEYQTRLHDTLLDLREKEDALDNLLETTDDKLQTKGREMEDKIKEFEIQIADLRKNHAQKMQDLEQKYKTFLHHKLDEQGEKYEEEIRGFSKEWNRERKSHVEDLGSNARSENQELEEQNRLTIAAMESSSNSNELLRQQVIAQAKEIDQLKSRHQNEVLDLQHLLESTAVQLKRASVAQSPLLTEPTEMEYLRNILYEYMMGRETTTLAKVIAAVVKFTDSQTQKVLEREETRHNVLAHILRT